jgi:hypothetical protein
VDGWRERDGRARARKKKIDSEHSIGWPLLLLLACFLSTSTSSKTPSRARAPPSPSNRSRKLSRRKPKTYTKIQGVAGSPPRVAALGRQESAPFPQPRRGVRRRLEGRAGHLAADAFGRIKLRRRCAGAEAGQHAERVRAAHRGERVGGSLSLRENQN